MRSRARFLYMVLESKTGHARTKAKVGYSRTKRKATGKGPKSQPRVSGCMLLSWACMSRRKRPWAKLEALSETQRSS